MIIIIIIIIIRPDFLDVIFNLKSATYYPYRKSSNELLHMIKHFHHPPSIINQIPPMISNRISKNSCDKNHNKPVPDYGIALKNRGFNYNITYISSQSKRKSRKRKIIWFNSPYSANVKTNDGTFLWDLLISSME